MFQHSQTLDGVAVEGERLTNSAVVSNTVDGLMLVTSSGVFRCQPRISPEELFLKLAVNSEDTAAADVLAITAGLDVNKLYEVGTMFSFVVIGKQFCSIKCKILLFTFKGLYQQSPTYIQDFITHCSLSRTLLSSSTSRIHPVNFNLKSCGSRAFPVSAPELWNSLPDSISNTLKSNVSEVGLKQNSGSPTTGHPRYNYIK